MTVFVCIAARERILHASGVSPPARALSLCAARTYDTRPPSRRPRDSFTRRPTRASRDSSREVPPDDASVVRLVDDARLAAPREAATRPVASNRPPPPPTRPRIRRETRETSPRRRWSRPPLPGSSSPPSPPSRAFDAFRSLPAYVASPPANFCGLETPSGIDLIVAPKPTSPTPGRAGADVRTRGAKITRRHSRRRHSLCRHSRRRARARTLVRRDSRLCRDYSFFFVVSPRRFPITDAHLEGETRARVELRGVFQLDASRRDAHARDRVRASTPDARHASPVEPSPPDIASNPREGSPLPFAGRATKARRALTTAPPYLRDDGEGTRVALLRRRERGVAFALFSRRAVALAGAWMMRAPTTRRRRRRERARTRLPRASRPRRTTRSAARGIVATRGQPWRRRRARPAAFARRGNANGGGRVFARRRRGDRAGASRRDDGGRRGHRADRDRGAGAGCRAVATICPCISSRERVARVRRRDVGDGLERDDLAVDEIVHRRAPRAIRAVHADDGDVFELEFGAHVREEGGERVRAVEVARRGRRGSREAERDDASRRDGGDVRVAGGRNRVRRSRTVVTGTAVSRATVSLWSSSASWRRRACRAGFSSTSNRSGGERGADEGRRLPTVEGDVGVGRAREADPPRPRRTAERFSTTAAVRAASTRRAAATSASAAPRAVTASEAKADVRCAPLASATAFFSADTACSHSIAAATASSSSRTAATCDMTAASARARASLLNRPSATSGRRLMQRSSPSQQC